jgi:tetratricopeptide (TPR) repeat protein/DNA-binding response OmpR family regulator
MNMNKELIFLCWEEGLRKEVESIMEFLCLKAVCIDDVEKFYNHIEKTEGFVAIIDVFLPRENGYLVCKKTKEKFENSKVYLMVSKGLSRDELMERWKADGIIYKPLDWKEVQEVLLKEEIDFKPPPEEGKTDFEGFIRILSDHLFNMRNAEIRINDEKIKVSYGWMEKGDFERIKLQMESEEIYCSLSPLREGLSEESIIHLSEVIREITRIKKGPSYISLEDTIPEVHLIKKEGLWFLTPYEVRLIREIEKGTFRVIEEEKKKLGDALYFLSLSGILSAGKKEAEVKLHAEKSSEEVEKEKPQKIEETYEEPAYPEEKVEEEKPVIEEGVKEEGWRLAPPEEGEEERKIIDEKKSPVLFSPPEELEALKKYSEEKYRLMSYQEELKEEEQLLEEILPPVRPEADKKISEDSSPSEEVVPESPEPIEEENKELSPEETEEESSPVSAEQPEEGEIPSPPPVREQIKEVKIKKEEKKRKISLKILPIPFILILGALLFFILFKREKPYERALKKAGELITLTNKEDFLKGCENIKEESLRIALHAIGYEAGWLDSIPQPPECKKDEKFCLLVKDYIAALNGNPPSSVKEEMAQDLFTTYLYGRILLFLKKEKGFLKLEETNLPVAQYILIKEACDMVSFHKIENLMERFPDEWKKRAVECAWRRKNYDFILKAYNSIEKKDSEILKLAALSYLENGDERGVKILEEIGSSEAYYQIANFMEKMGKKEEAVKYYSMVKEGEFLELAKRRLRTLQEKTVEKPLPKMEEQKPDLKSLIGKAVSERRRANTEEAIRLLKEALKIDPENPDANYHLGMLLLEMGDFEPAKRHLNKFLKNASPADGRRKDVSALLETIP